MLRYRRKRNFVFLGGEYLPTFHVLQTPRLFMAGLVSFLFLLFDEVDDDEREEYDEQKRRPGWYEKAVPEALSFFYCLRTVAR